MASHPVTSLFVAARRACRSLPGTLGPTLRVRPALLCASLAVPCVACAAEGPSGYIGTGSLTLSGSAAQPLLASKVAELSDCPSLRKSDGVFAEFSIMALGDRCVMDGIVGADSFHPDPGTVCVLQFVDGAHAIKVTDVTLRNGITSDDFGHSYNDPNLVEILVGGDDASTSVHALYRFTGAAAEQAPAMSSCSVERSKRAGRVPNAFEADPPEPLHPQAQ